MVSNPHTTPVRRIPAALLLAACLIVACTGRATATGFTDSYATFYGEIRQVGGAGTVLLQSGNLRMTFVNQANPANRVVLEAPLAPTGPGTVKSYSYAIKAPLAYLPEATLLGDQLAINAQKTDFRIEEITIDGRPATLPDGSKEFFTLSFASRAEHYRLDLLVGGDSTDTDRDGMPDWWEDLYGLDKNLSSAALDSDSDGWSDLSEFQRGSNPAVSNRVPQLVTAEIFLPESATAGIHLRVFDSDTETGGIQFTVSSAGANGFRLLLDGSEVSPDAPVSLSLSQIQAGRLTVVHSDPAIRTAVLDLTWTDGGATVSGDVILRAVAPSTADGNDASLWLDAASLAPDQPLATWPDRSGNQRDAMQPIAGNRPATVTTDGRSSVDFSGGKRHLFFNDVAIPVGNHTVIAVWESPGTGLDPQVVLSSNRGFLRLDPSAAAVSYPGSPFYQTDGLAVRGHESTLGSTALSIFRKDQNTLQNVFGLHFNGEAASPELIEPVLPTIGARRLALPVEEPISDGFTGRLHELLVFPSALPEQKLRGVHDYVRSKWSRDVVWDFSTSLSPVSLLATGPGSHIIRGGHGNDDLGGGGAANLISGGPGTDILRAGPGRDTFVFGGIDTGKDVITGFNSAMDVIDLSALFWGQSGDARSFIATRLDTNFSTPVPTLDTVLVVRRSATVTQEIVLQNTILGSQQLIQYLVEGKIRMGSLSVPTTVSLTRVPPVGPQDGSFTLEVRRSGAGLPASLSVPLGDFSVALDAGFVIDGNQEHDGRRTTVAFARGESVKRLTFRPLPDLDAEAPETWTWSILPSFRYVVSGQAATGLLIDKSTVTLAVLAPNALVAPPTPARVRILRNGDLSAPLAVAIALDGSAIEGVHIAAVPRSFTIPAGQDHIDVTVATQAGWNGSSTRMAMLRLQGSDTYQAGTPHEATLYVSGTATEASGSGFERWIGAASGGRFGTIHELLHAEGSARMSDYIRAYAFGDASPDTINSPDVSFRVVENRPELTTRARSGLPDLHWQVQDAADSKSWTNVGAQFSETPHGSGIRLLGPPLALHESKKFYRLGFTVDSGDGLSEGVSTLVSAANQATTGQGSWKSGSQRGQIVATGAAAGATSQLIVEVTEPTLLDFEMAVRGGDGTDLLAFYVNGLRVAETQGAATRVKRTLDSPGKTILMWEFRRSTGDALISNIDP